jgi:hypothetical protein
MITEDYVSFETAKLLKEKGFDEDVLAVYIYDNLFVKGENKIVNTANVPIIPAPTLQMAMKWLREVYNIDISIIPLRSHKEYLPRIESDTISHDAIPCRKYEDACEAAIKYCLDNLDYLI